MNVSLELLLIILCGLIVLSYFFSILSSFIKVPSVLLLLFTGIAFRAIAQANNFYFSVPAEIVDGLGVVGLIMIVLEAGLDLELSKNKISLIGNSFLAALFILIFSAALLTGILYYWLHEDIVRCIVYALPLSIMSSSIVLPSIHHLTKNKKEFVIFLCLAKTLFLGVMHFCAYQKRTTPEIPMWSPTIILTKPKYVYFY